jgi:hypothetical protein
VRWMVLYYPPDYIRFFRRISVISWALRLPSGYFTSSDGEVAKHLLMNHFTSCQPIEEHLSWGRILHEPAQEDWDLASELVSEDKVRWVIDGFGTFKAAGADGIFPSLLQHRIEIIIGHYYKHFCCMFGVWLHTPAWRAVRVIFIPKPGRDSYELAESFRPISLTSFFLKTMERLVDSFISAGPLNPSRLWNHSICRGRSTEAALHDLVLFKKLKGT